MVRNMDLQGFFKETSGRETVENIIDGFAEGHNIINNSGWDGIDADDLDSETPIYYDNDDLELGIDTEE